MPASTQSGGSRSSTRMVFGGTDLAQAAPVFARTPTCAWRSRLQGKRENPAKQGRSGWKHQGKQKTGRSGRADALRERRDASHRIPPCHKFIPWDPTAAQVYPKGSHRSTGVSQRIPPRHSPTRTWLGPVAVPLPAAASLAAPPPRGALGSKHGKRGKI